MPSITASRRCNGAAPGSTARRSRRCGRSAWSRRSCCSRCSGRLPPFFQPTVLLMIGAAGGALRWAAMALDPPAFALPWLQLLHAASFGATHLGALGFVARHAPAGQGATAQGYLAIARRRDDGGGDRTVGLALRQLRQPRLCGDGASGGRWRRFAGRSRTGRAVKRRSERHARAFDRPVAARHDAVRARGLPCRSSCATDRRAG